MSMELALTFALVASFCYGTSKFLIKKANNVNPLVSVLYTFLLAPPILLGFALFNGDLSISYTFSPLTITYLALAGVFYLAIGESSLTPASTSLGRQGQVNSPAPR